MVGDRSKEFWWKSLVGGLLFLVLGILLFVYYADFEQPGGARRIHAFVTLTSRIGGKWTAGAVCGLVALWFFYGAYKQLRRSNND